MADTYDDAPYLSPDYPEYNYDDYTDEDYDRLYGDNSDIEPDYSMCIDQLCWYKAIYHYGILKYLHMRMEKYCSWYVGYHWHNRNSVKETKLGYAWFWILSKLEFKLGNWVYPRSK